MITTFHLFPLLPPELRLKIWHLATVDRSLARANLFSIHPSGTDSFATSNHSAYFGPPFCGHGCSHDAEYCMTWEHHRGCASLADSGLWDACQDSRNIMYQMRKRLTEAGRPTRPITAIATDAQQDTRRFTFLPSKDVFIFDLLNYYQAVKHHCWIDAPFNFSRKLVRLFEHIAFEFDIKWFEGQNCSTYTEEGRLARELLVKLALDLTEDTTIYLIDYRLCRHATPPREHLQMDTSVFHGLNGRFIEVIEEDGWGYVCDNPPIPSAVRLMREVWTSVHSATYWVMDREMACRHARLALLAWEPDQKDIHHGLP